MYDCSKNCQNTEEQVMISKFQVNDDIMEKQADVW